MRAKGDNITKHRISIHDLQSMSETVWADSTSLYFVPLPTPLLDASSSLPIPTNSS